MSDKKISQLDASTTPLAGTEVLAVVQSGDTKKVSVANLTVGRAVSALSLTALASGTADAISLVQNSTGSSRMVQGGDGNTYILNDGAKNMILGTSGATKMTIYDATGDVGLQGGSLFIPSGKGIDFSADGQAAGMTSELLDDYEEGTFTPTFTNLTVGDGAVFGRYTKVGRIVNVALGFIYGSTSSITGSIGDITGLPFSVINTVTNGFELSVGAIFKPGVGWFSIMSNLQNNGTTLLSTLTLAGVGITSATPTTFVTGTTLTLSITYEAA